MFSISEILAVHFQEQKKTAIDPKVWLNKLLDYGRDLSEQKLTEQQILKICQLTKNSIDESRMLVNLYAPVKVMGMVQGQFRDLIKIFDVFGHPDRINYIFLGGYVNKGPESIQTICLLFIYKILRPANIHLLRGSDESQSITKIFGFYDQCKRNYGLRVWKSICDIFAIMPYAALIENKIFCVHGGLSPELINPRDVYQIQHESDIPKQGLACDLVWSDPQQMAHGYQKNSRGLSYSFGRDILDKFLYVNNLDLVVRSHQIVEQGFQLMFDKKILTLCSAPNYMGKFKNKAAILLVDSNLKCSIQVYEPKAQENKALNTD